MELIKRLKKRFGKFKQIAFRDLSKEEKDYLAEKLAMEIVESMPFLLIKSIRNSLDDNIVISPDDDLSFNFPYKIPSWSLARFISDYRDMKGEG